MPQSVYSIVRQGLRYNYGEQGFRDFSGGLNLRDAPTELAANESPDMMNVTLDERGSVGKRLGYLFYFNPSNGAVSHLYYWPTGQNLISQSGDSLYKDNNAVAFKTFTTSARCDMCDFKGLLLIVHPVDGLFKYDGTTLTAIGAGPKGNTIEPWQNKLWVSGDPAAKSRVYFSAAGDETSWPGTSFVDLREKDTEPCVNLAGAAGVDISGRQGLLAFKQRSTYRIFDSTTGAFQTLDTAVGAAGPLAVVSAYQRTAAISEAGIFWTDGVGPMRNASDKISPLFDPLELNFGQLDLWCAGARGTRMYFSVPASSSTTNTLELEYHPLQGWITPHAYDSAFLTAGRGASAYATYGKNDQKLYMVPSGLSEIMERFRGGVDSRSNPVLKQQITSRYQTHWVELTGGHPARVGRIRVLGRGGPVTVEVRTDYQDAAAESYSLNFAGTAAVYDDAGAVYDQAGVLYGPVKNQDVGDYPANAVCRAVALRFTETSSAASSKNPLLGLGVSPEIGNWGVYAVTYSYYPLGLN